MKKKRDWKIILERIVFLSFIVPIVYLILRLIFPSSSLPRSKSDYVLMLVQCILGVCALFAPSVISHKWKIKIPSAMYCLYIIFLYCAVFLGEVASFYYKVSHWDTYLHTFSGVMIGALSFSVVSLLNDEDKIHIKLSPAFVALFAFSFSLALGAVWEIYEFVLDQIMGLNMQKYAAETGEQFIGKAALADTMKDLIVDALGAVAISVVGYISLKYEKNWIEKFLFKRKSVQ